MVKMIITENHVSAVELAGYEVSAFTVALLEQFERGELNLSKADKIKNFGRLDTWSLYPL